MSNLFSHFLNKFIPAQCLLCSNLIASYGQSATFCSACRHNLPYWHADQSCPQCARPDTAGLLCGACQKKPPAFDLTHAAFLFQEPVKALIHAAKFGQQWAIFPALAAQLAQTCSPIEADYLIPLPLHPNRLKERGFNQALEIARSLSPQWGIPIRQDVLFRTRDTEHQARLSANARWKNLRGAFECRANLHDMSVIIVDDVMTSGASLQAAAKAVKSAGAKQIINLVLARTPLHS